MTALSLSARELRISALALPGLDVLRGHHRDPSGDFLGMPGEVTQGLLLLRRLDALEQVLRSVDSGHGCAVLPGLLQFGDRAGDGAGQSVDPVPLGEQSAVVSAQGVHLIDLLGQDPADLGP
ncbi:hypothetical protein ASD51_28270 [Streptomyces sp. Root55]|nr:hypothetical protein ASD26_09030 [Streptomyces sp. Root1319]KQZ19701.1 hypothetical protein ASD51_28270 [Streptomyces sp. Root55]